MAIEVYSDNNRTIKKITDLLAEQGASDGVVVKVPDFSMVIIDPGASGGAGEVTISASLEKPADVEAGTAVFVPYKSVKEGTGEQVIFFDPGPTYLKFSADVANCTVWIRM